MFHGIIAGFFQYFSVSNGMKEEGVLSPTLFSII